MATIDETWNRFTDIAKRSAIATRNLASGIGESLEDNFGAVTECADGLLRAQRDTFLRIAENQLEWADILADAALLPAELANEVYGIIESDIRPSTDTPPILYELRNPHGSVWGGAGEDMVPVNVSVMDSGVLFVHGMNYEMNSRELFKDLFERYEKNARMYERPRLCDQRIFLINYDSKITNEMETLIKDTLIGLGSA